MLKVLVAALVGTVVGVAVMVTVIAIAGTDTEGSTSVGLGSLPLSTQSPTRQSRLVLHRKPGRPGMQMGGDVLL